MIGRKCQQGIKARPLILVAEDVPRNLEIVCNILRKEDYRIAAASNGRQVLEMIPLLQPDLILMDVMMPELDGFEVCAQIKQNKATRDIPIIFLTAKTETTDIVNGFDIGAVDYVTKPFNGTELLSRVKTHLELKFSRETLADLLATRDKFFSIIAHDLRDPLQFLILAADTLYNQYDTVDEEKKKDYIRRFFNCSTQISQLLENLLEWSMSQRGIIKYRPEKLNISQLVHENIELIKERAQKKNISISSYIGDEITAFADKNMINVVIRNLITNGVKFSYPGGEVKIDGIMNDTCVEISVTDSGIGMSAEDAAQLFRVDRNRSGIGTDNEKGSGLGLILCRDFVERNNGMIDVTSEPEKGTCFRFVLPRYK